ncbi:hypothetical protein [Paenibacillus ehimensis]|uniref:Uncharacterized protein n=1 Tax=Paenibacillus ehimensis TaxID=79264 RepID=A0ABT8VMA8_9BACL|nr:hypothetical protein [Paenibacillus ehimensis]MDO3682122.1 hypothetical protein [Paenibacillus ehimensis]
MEGADEQLLACMVKMERRNPIVCSLVRSYFAADTFHINWSCYYPSGFIFLKKEEAEAEAVTAQRPERSGGPEGLTSGSHCRRLTPPCPYGMARPL